MNLKHKKRLSIVIVVGVMIALAGCTDQQPVQVNNYYITNSDGSVQSAIPDVNVPTVSTESKVDSSSTTSQVFSNESKETTVTVNTDSNLVVGITYTVTGTTNYLALRNAPAYDGSNEIAKLKNGDEVTIQSQNVYGDKNEYCYVTVLSGSANGQSGYVNKAYLTPSTNKSNTNSVNSTSQNKDVSSKNDVGSKVNSNTSSKEESHTEFEVSQQTESTLPVANAPYTAVELINMSLSEIVDIMGGSFQFGARYVGDSIESSLVICNPGTLPGYQFVVKGVTYDAFESNQTTVTQDIKDGKYDIQFIYFSGSFKLDENISADMSYKDLTNFYGEFGCLIAGGAGNAVYSKTDAEQNVNITFEFDGDLIQYADGGEINAETMKAVNPKIKEIMLYRGF